MDIDVNVKLKDRWTKIKFYVKVGFNMSFFLFHLILKLLKMIWVHRKVSLEPMSRGNLT